MSIFGKIAEAIFGSPANAATIEPPAGPQPGAAAKTVPPPAAGSATPPAAPARVDVAAILDRLEDERGEDDIDWRKSIVDLMKLLDLDSSLKSRRELAKELGYAGDTGDTAKMNVWLHKQVMTKLADNGGIVPKELKD